jgi:lysophospholipase L1-like esterase
MSAQLGPLKKTMFSAAVALVFLFVLNAAAALFYDGRYLLQNLLIPVNDKAYSPSLADDPERSVAIFREFEALRTRYEPYVAWSRLPFAGETTTVNVEGDRVHPVAPESPDVHIRLFGGSTMWGKGVADEGTIPARLAGLRPRSAVHNHGESGFVSRQALARLINLLNQDEPTDAVVFYDGCNDFYTLCRSDVSINGHSREVKIRDKMTPRSYILDTLVGALRETIAYLLLQVGVIRDAPSRCAEDSAHARLVAETMVANWRIAKEIADARGIEFHAFLQPIATAGAPDIGYLGFDAEADNPRHRSYRTVYPLVQEIIRARGGDWMHDLSDAFDGQGAIYIDGCHVNERGNAIIADRIHSKIRL